MAYEFSDVFPVVKNAHMNFIFKRLRYDNMCTVHTYVPRWTLRITFFDQTCNVCKYLRFLRFFPLVLLLYSRYSDFAEYSSFIMN